MANNAADGLAILGWVFCGLLAGIVLVCIGASRGSIPLGTSVGLRVAPVTQNDQTWAAGHKAAIPGTLVGFCGGLVCAIVGVFVTAAYWGVLFFLVLSYVWAIIAATRAARQVA